jgi:ribonuclease BN (tRNA processing enzyme)
VAFTLTVLGTAATYPRPGEPCSGYLARTPHTALWIDAGPGTFAALQEHLDPAELTGLWISHLHPDHCADLLPLTNWALNTPDAPRLPVHGPPGWAHHLAAFLPLPEPLTHLRRIFALHEHDIDPHEHHDLTLRTTPVHHSAPTWALRLDHHHTSLTYSADTGPCPALADLAHHTDLFLCEAGTNTPNPYHCTPHDTAHLAAQAQARTLLITHTPTPQDRETTTRTAQQTTTCPTHAAAPGQHHTLTP